MNDGVGVFPSGELVVEGGPLDEQLLDGAMTTMLETCLQHSFRDLHGVVRIGEGAGYGRRMRCRRLEEGDVEDRVDGGGRRELELVRHVAHLGQDLERPEILEAKLSEDCTYGWRRR